MYAAADNYFHSMIFHQQVFTSHMIFIVLLVTSIAIISMIDAVPIGLVNNASLIIPSYNTVIVYASSCNECVCTMYLSSDTDPILSFNCYLISSNHVACETFTVSTYNISSTYLLQGNASSTFYFRQLPSENQFEATTVMASTMVSDRRTETDSTAPSITIITQTGDFIVGVYNTTAGGPTGARDGRYSGSAEVPPKSIDNNVTTKYLNFGSTGNFGVTAPAPGVGTGFYVTPSISNASVAVALRFATGNDEPDRDPLTVTLEGTNSTALDLAAGWTLIYNGSTGIDPSADPGRQIFVPQQNFSNTIAYRSYRLLVTSQRNAAWCVQYAEAQIIGYI